MLIVLSTIFAIFICFMKHYVRKQWAEYKNSVEFYKQIVASQVKLGLMDEEDLTENFKIKDVTVCSILKGKMFWLEVFMLLLIPYPFSSGTSLFGRVPDNFQQTAINWAGGSTLHAEVYTVTYKTTDIFTCLCFLRVYFIIDAILVYLPFNLLFGKKVARTNEI